jgi:outer membrane protein assembly factor BamD
MTVSMPWRTATGVVLTLSVLLAGCGSSPSDESSASNVQKLYKEARDDMDSGSYEKATKALERVEGLAAGTLLAQQAQLDLAYVNWRSGEKATAITTIDRFIKLNPSSPAMDYALYLKGLVNYNEDIGVFGFNFGQDLSERDQRASRDAYQAFRLLVDQYPQSKYSPDARKRMNYIVNSLAHYEIHVARYYYRRGAYLAAANRAQQAVTDFQQSAVTEEALAIMAQSYDKLNLLKLRDDTFRILRENYPHSAYLEDGLQAEQQPQRPWWKLW